MRFSQRHGLQPPPGPLKHDAMPDGLRNRLWTIVRACLGLWSRMDDYGAVQTGLEVYQLWDSFYKESADTLPRFPNEAIDLLRGRFYRHSWYELYGLLEIIVEIEVGQTSKRSRFAMQVNKVLEQEMAAWRFVGTKLQQVTEPQEIQSIEDALSNPLAGVRLHIQGALSCLAQRPEPDTRNAIKEAISAVESAAKAVTGKEKDTYSALVQRLKADGAHPQFVEAWKNLYNYTSDAGGVRHGARENDAIPTVDEAKLFVITASAFTNYLAARYSTA